MTTPERRVKDKVRKALVNLGVYYFMPVQSGIGAPALDFYCCYRGRFVAIETKVPGAKLTPRQCVIAGELAGAGALVFAIRTQDDVNSMIRLLSPPPKNGWIVDELGSLETHGRQWCP